MTMYDALFMLYLKQRRMGDAEKIVQDKVRNFPDDPNAYVQLAAFYMANRKADDMRRTIETLTQDGKRFPLGYEQAGDFYLRTRNIDDAMKSLPGWNGEVPRQETRISAAHHRGVHPAGKPA